MYKILWWSTAIISTMSLRWKDLGYVHGKIKKAVEIHTLIHITNTIFLDYKSILFSAVSGSPYCPLRCIWGFFKKKCSSTTHFIRFVYFIFYCFHSKFWVKCNQWKPSLMRSNTAIILKRSLISANICYKCIQRC